MWVLGYSRLNCFSVNIETIMKSHIGFLLIAYPERSTPLLLRHIDDYQEQVDLVMNLEEIYRQHREDQMPYYFILISVFLSYVEISSIRFHPIPWLCTFNIVMYLNKRSNGQDRNLRYNLPLVALPNYT